MMTGRIVVCVFVGLIAPCLGQDEAKTMNQTVVKSDREQVIDHIHSIFQAYVGRDREAIRRTHTVDWTGFQGPSTQIERGIEAYMKNADASLESLQGTGYELLDTEVQLYGDLALVYYVARYDYRDAEGKEGSIPLRSIDVYRREGDGWNQAGSHITVIPSTASWGGDSGKGKAQAPVTEPEEARTLSATEREELLGAREAVWRAWFSNDAEALQRVVPKDVIAIDPGVEAWADEAEVVSRAAKFAAEGAKLIRLEFPQTRIQVYGHVAILYTTYLFETEKDGEHSVMSGRGTEIFVRRNGTWLNAGWHLDSGA